jgi:hypothetical protein
MNSILALRTTFQVQDLPPEILARGPGRVGHRGQDRGEEPASPQLTMADHGPWPISIPTLTGGRLACLELGPLRRTPCGCG